MSTNTTSPLIAIARHRLAVDGQGVTTLVAFHGCPLCCCYCLNPQCLKADGVWKTVRPDELLEMVMADNLYFEATGGGITFGGGEPLLRADFIATFCHLAEADERIHTPWRISLETSLNVPHKNVETVLPFVHHFIVDVKDMNPDIYQRYTTQCQGPVLNNLKMLASVQTQTKVTLRLPLIPDFNTPTDICASRQQLEAMGFDDFDEFEYIKSACQHAV